MNTFVFSARPYEIPFLLKASPHHAFSFTHQKLTADTVGWAAGHKAVALFTADDASSAMIEKLYASGVKYIALRSAGFDHVDLEKCKALGIHVANVPAYSPYSVAEHAATLLMVLNRKIIEGRRLMLAHDFRLDTLLGFDIHGKTVGIIGTGTIGMSFARIMHGFGARLIGTDPVQNPDAQSVDLTYVSMEELFRSSDIISIHCPLNEHTRYLIAKQQLDQMKPTCILINTARGGIVCTEDLLSALENGRLGGACLDVYEKEKTIFFEDHRDTPDRDELFERLMANPNVMITGHQGFLTREALSGIAATTVKTLDYWDVGKKSPTELY
jgi:D-lactate dehydrogenase